MTRIAFLGTGLLGSAFVEAALARGDDVTVWNRTAEKAQALEKFGARSAATPADAVRGAEHVHLVLKDDPVVEEVIAALRPGLDRNAIIIDHTTTQPAETAARSARLNREGVNYLHCPVFIGPVAARQNKGTILCAGRKDLFDKVQPALAKMADHVEYFGERADLAAVYKLCGNALIIGLNSTVSDVLAIATSAGVNPGDVLKVADFVNPAAIIAVRGKNMIAKNFKPTFELTMARKDVRLMLETAKQTPLAVLPGVAKRMDDLIAKGHGADDLAVIAIDGVR
jgi:3-hydroxyisobutyrate dehydrogenase-like beta-hydroxyacid dehydrogenase